MSPQTSSLFLCLVMDYSKGSFQKVIEKAREKRAIIDSEVGQTGTPAWRPLALVMSQPLGCGHRGGRAAGAGPSLLFYVLCWPSLFLRSRVEVGARCQVHRSALSWCVHKVHTAAQLRRRPRRELQKVPAGQEPWPTSCPARQSLHVGAGGVSSSVSGFSRSSRGLRAADTL